MYFTTNSLNAGSGQTTGGFVINGCTFRNNSFAADNTYDAIEIDPKQPIGGGLITGCDFTSDAGNGNGQYDSGGGVMRYNRVRYGVRIRNTGAPSPPYARNVTIGPCGTVFGAATVSALGTALLLSDGLSTRTTPSMLAQSAVAVAHTGSTTPTTLATITVPGGLMGPNGRLRIAGIWSRNATGTAATTLRVRFGGTAGSTFYVVAIPTTERSERFEIEIANRGVNNSQIGGANAKSGGWGSISGTPSTAAQGTAIDKDIVLIAELANAADTITLESYTVELIP